MFRFCLRSFQLTLLLAGIAFGLCSCDSDRRPDWYIDSDLIGSWRLVVTCGGIGGGCTQADSTDAIRVMTLSHNGDYREVINDSVVVQGKYQITRRKWEISGSVTECLSAIGPYVDRCVIRITRDSLTLGDDIIDGYTYTYVALGNI